MDERFFKCKIGSPIPEWDLRHRLSIHEPVGPLLKDCATTFRRNSKFMDVSDQPYMMRQWFGGGVLTLCFGCGAYLWVLFFMVTHPPHQISAGLIWMYIAMVSFAFGFGYFAFRIGRNEFFALSRRPIRFHREEKKIFAIRQRRFFAQPGEGDITWEIPWDEESIFCIHKGRNTNGRPYHIRHYSVDENGNVTRAFAIGREWDGAKNIEGLLAQWNYWCWFMNHGPADLPPPALYFKEKETALESYLFCLYELGFTASAASRIFWMPFILLLTSHRLLAMWTCRQPVWPDWVEKVSGIARDDPHDQPRGSTPVGWGDTMLARNRYEYPYDPKRKLEGWQGEPDGEKNAALWAQDVPPPFRQRATAKDTE